MLQGLFSPNMELLSSIENNYQLWSSSSHPDSNNHQVAAMEAILSQASLGLISDYQSLAPYGILNHSSINIEGMDETQVLPASSSNPCVNPELSSNSATNSPSLGLDHGHYTKHSSKPNNMISFSHDLSKGQAVGMCAVSASKRRSWQEALSSPSRVDHYINPNAVNPNHNERELSPSAPNILYSANDPKAPSIIASLAYPCTIVEHTHDPSLNNSSKGMINHITNPIISTRINETMNSASNLCADNGGNSRKKDSFKMGGCGNWQENIHISTNQGQLSEIKGGIISPHEYTSHGCVYKGIKYDDDPGQFIYKDQAMHANHKEKDINTPRQPTVPQASADPDHPSRKRPAADAHMQSSYAKRAHLQNKPGSSTTTTSTTTKSSKSSSRNPQGPALNTNGRPRAQQGSANDPQSVAARNRRERINARLKVLQELVPNGSKVDLVTMLEKAINYVKFLQLQLRVLSNDDYWQANQDNVEQAATTRLEDGYSTQVNVVYESMMARSDDREDQYNYV